jgi:2-polyprenyl-3-methyl-5-hydroxy-6-metoxy-1,4-benzoquinol methylase
MNKYRTRIYSHYVEAQSKSVVPLLVDELAGRAPTMRRVIRDFFPKEKVATILDLGCGHGTLVYFALQAGYINTQGVDVSVQQVDLAHKLGVANVRQGDLMEALKTIPPASLNAVVTFDVIEHFTKDELIDLVDAVNNALKPAGRWIIHAPNANSPFFGSIRYGDYTHEQAFTPSSLGQLLKSSKFLKVEFAECAPIVHGFKSFFRVGIWRLVRFVFMMAHVAETGEFGRDVVLTRNFYAVAIK